MEKPSVYVLSFVAVERSITASWDITLWGCITLERARIQSEEDATDLMREAKRQVFISNLNFIDVTVTAVNLVS